MKKRKSIPTVENQITCDEITKLLPDWLPFFRRRNLQFGRNVQSPFSTFPSPLKELICKLLVEFLSSSCLSFKLLTLTSHTARICPALRIFPRNVEPSNVIPEKQYHLFDQSDQNPPPTTATVLQRISSNKMAIDVLKSIQWDFPTVDRPFGIALWPLFDKLYSSVMGYSPQDFRFIAKKTPISTFRATATILISYYLIILAGREIMKTRAPLKLNGLFMVHNLCLTLVSATWLALFIEQLLPTVWKRGIFFAICDHRGGWTEQLVILYYVSPATEITSVD